VCCRVFVVCACVCVGCRWFGVFVGLWCLSAGCDPLRGIFGGFSLGKFFSPAAALAPSPSSRVSRRLLCDFGRFWRGVVLFGSGGLCVCVFVCCRC
jgi:hypothetical protein